MKKLLLWILILSANWSFAQKTYLHCGKLIDGKSNQVFEEMTIIVEAGKIVAVEKGYAKSAENDQLIDLKDKTVLPGLMDMHVYMVAFSAKSLSFNRNLSM